VTAPTEDRRSDIAGLIAARLRDVPDFPQPGILFKDITPLLADGLAFRASIQTLADLARAAGPVDVVCGIEARGFIVAAALAGTLECGVVPMRKAGKLPPPVLHRAYALEYGTAEIEVPGNVLDGKRVYLVDDVLATGGTLAAALDLIRLAGGSLTGVGVLVELGFLNGRSRLPEVPLNVLLRV
jgi:adenine phosphoribosyltransferase